MVLRIVAELLGGGGIAKEEGEGGEDVLARRRKGGRGGEVLGHIGFGGHDERLKKWSNEYVCVCVCDNKLYIYT